MLIGQKITTSNNMEIEYKSTTNIDNKSTKSFSIRGKPYQKPIQPSSTTTKPVNVLVPRLKNVESKKSSNSIPMSLLPKLTPAVTSTPLLKLDDIISTPKLQDVEFKDQLGSGTFGTVWKVIDPKSKKFYALKESDLYLEQDDNSQFCSALRETFFLKTMLPHPNIIQCYDVKVDFDSKKAFILMELMDGNLVDLLQSETFEKRLFLLPKLMKDIFSALHYMHLHEYGHRDIKPENILYKKVNGEYIFKLADFGLVKKLRGGPCFTGTVITFTYRPPELFFLQSNSSNSHHNYGLEVDIWSLGLTLLNYVIGSYVIYGKDEAEHFLDLAYVFPTFEKYTHLFSNVSNQERIKKPIGIRGIVKRRFPSYYDKIPSDLFDLIEKMTKVNPSERISIKTCIRHSYFMNRKILFHSYPVVRSKVNFLDWTSKHPEIDIEKVRQPVIEYLHDVAKEFKFNIQTFSHAIEIMDLYGCNCKTNIKRSRIQLVSICSLYIAMMLTEIDIFSVSEFLYETEDAYDTYQFSKCCQDIVECLNYQLPKAKLSNEIIRLNSSSSYATLRDMYIQQFPSNNVYL